MAQQLQGPIPLVALLPASNFSRAPLPTRRLEPSEELAFEPDTSEGENFIRSERQEWLLRLCKIRIVGSSARRVGLGGANPLALVEAIVEGIRG